MLGAKGVLDGRIRVLGLRKTQATQNSSGSCTRMVKASAESLSVDKLVPSFFIACISLIRRSANRFCGISGGHVVISTILNLGGHKSAFLSAGQSAQWQMKASAKEKEQWRMAP